VEPLEDPDWDRQSFVADISSQQEVSYAINEISNFAGPNTVGSATSMAVDSTTGDLRIMNVVSSGGAGPARVGIDPQGKWLFAANYGGGSVAVLPILADGSLGPAADVQMLTGPLGPQPA
jgi:6-phosphogluconolactonase (cycloisomerase 2 family)